MRITKEKLTEISQDYLRTLNHLSNLKEMARQIEKDLEKHESKAKVLEPTVDNYNRDKNKREE